MGLTIYGSPWQPRFHDWAFNLDRGAALAEKWTRIPDRVDILITHGPPRGIGDRVYDGRLEGCDDLLERVRVVRPRLHVFGHIHEAAGVYRGHGTVFVNASCLKWLDTQPTCGPFLIDWETGEVLSSSADSDA